MAEDNKPKGNEGGEGQGTEPQKEVVSYAKYKRETDEYQEQVKALKAELEQRDKQIEEFTSKAGNAEELQAALDKAKADNEAYKADAEKREADMRRDFAIDTKLAQMGVRNAKAARAIIPNIADAKLDEQGNLTGIDFEALKKDNAYMFTDQPRESAGGDPKGGAGSDGLADFRAAFGLTDESKELIMPNSIELPKGYENVLMEAYRKESLTAVLESAAPQGNIAQMEQLGEFYYPVYSMGGLGDVQANGRLPQNSGASLTWKPISANYDRGTILEIDQKVDAQSFNLAFGNAAAHFNRTKVVPEGDAFVFSTLCAGTGITKEQKTYADGADMLKGLNAAMCDMDEKEVPEEGRVLFITPTLLGMVKDLDTTKSREALDGFSSIVKVPQSRFYSAIDLLDGTTKDEEIGHYKKGTGAVDMNFLIVHKDAVVLRWNFAHGKVIDAEDNQQGFGHLFKYRKYGVCGVRENLAHYITAGMKAA